MKRIFLFRHAKAGYDEPDDFARTLSGRGRKAARLMGRMMREQGLAFDLVLSSPAARAVETLQEAEEGYGQPLQPRLFPDLYLASPATLLAAVRALEEAAENVLIAGHNPGMHQFALLLAGAQDAGRNRITDGFPTAALAEIAVPAKRWAEVAEGSGTIERFLAPKELD